MSTEALFMHVFVRRTGVGSAPFTWEVHGDGITPIHVSSERYRSMDAAYQAGKARLEEFIRSKELPRRNRIELDVKVPRRRDEMSVSS
jgi:hypothetical protein